MMNVEKRKTTIVQKMNLEVFIKFLVLKDLFFECHLPDYHFETLQHGQI